MWLFGVCIHVSCKMISTKSELTHLSLHIVNILLCSELFRFTLSNLYVYSTVALTIVTELYTLEFQNLFILKLEICAL